MEIKTLWLLGMLGLVVFLGSGQSLNRDVLCAARTYGDGNNHVCVCNSTYCDTVNRPPRLPQGQYHQYSTSNSTPGFSHTVGSFTTDPPVDDEDAVFTVNSSVKFQEIVGFGGAFTDSAGVVFNALPQGAQDNLIASYFSTSGIEYTLGRTPIGASDFSSSSYTLDDVNNDFDLKYFNLTYADYNYKIPMIKKAMAISERPIKIMGCSWVSPSWMKQTNASSGFPKIKYLEALSQYHLKFLEAYQQNGIDVWSLSGGNEVMIMLFLSLNKGGLLNGTIMTAPVQRLWFKDYLKPLLMASNFSNVKLIALEDQRLFANYWMDRFAEDPKALEAVDVIGLHWYFDFLFPTSLLDDLHEKYPDKLLMYTESSINIAFGTGLLDIGLWLSGELYILDMFENFNHWVQSYVDWNLCLDLDGGPCLGPPVNPAIYVNTTSGEFYKQPIFYVMGHFSKFLPPGAKRILVDSNQNDTEAIDKMSSGESLKKIKSFVTLSGLGSTDVPLPITAIIPTVIWSIGTENPDGSYTIIVFSSLNETKHVRIEDDRVGTISVNIEAKSLNSFIYWLD